MFNQNSTIHTYLYAKFNQKVSAQFDTGSWTCSVSATTYLGRLYLRDTLESQPVHLTILYPPSHAKIRVANDVSGQVVGVSGRPLDVECLAYGGVPSPEIAWHLGGVLQSQELSSRTPHHSRGQAGRGYRTSWLRLRLRLHLWVC